MSEGAARAGQTWECLHPANNKLFLVLGPDRWGHLRLLDLEAGEENTIGSTLFDVYLDSWRRIA